MERNDRKNPLVGDTGNIPIQQLAQRLGIGSGYNASRGDSETLADLFGDILDSNDDEFLHFGDFKVAKDEVFKALRQNKNSVKTVGSAGKESNAGDDGLPDHISIVDLKGQVLQFHSLATNQALGKAFAQAMKNSAINTPANPITKTAVVAGGTATVSLLNTDVVSKRQMGVIYAWMGRKMLMSASSTVYTYSVTGTSVTGELITAGDTQYMGMAKDIVTACESRVVLGKIVGGTYNPMIAEINPTDPATLLSFTVTGAPDGEVLTVVFPTITYIPFAQLMKDWKILTK